MVKGLFQVTLIPRMPSTKNEVITVFDSLVNILKEKQRVAAESL